MLYQLLLSGDSEGSGSALVVDGVTLMGVHITSVSETMLTVLLLLLVVTLARVVFHYFLVEWVPESAVVILMGALGGVILWAIGVEEHTILTFNAEAFFLILIPPIIFEAGYHLDKHAFMSNWGSIVLLAVVGTFISTMATGFFIWAVRSTFESEISLAESLAFGSLISAVDPVAVISIFEKIHVNDTLNILVFGESVLNDAVSIVLYNLFMDLRHVETFTAAVPFLAIVKFLYVSLGAIVLGTAMGLLAGFLTRFTGHEHIYVVESLLVAVVALLSYVVAEILLMSGIVAVLFAGIVMSRYVEANINHASHVTIKHLLVMVATTTEMIVFIYLGVQSVFHLAGADGGDLGPRWDAPFITLTLVFILPLRFAVVYSLTWLANKRRLDRVPLKDQFIMAFGGLRGAIAFALAFIMPSDVESRDIIITTTFIVILFTVFVCGTTLRPLLTLLSVRTQGEEAGLPQHILPRIFSTITDGIGIIVRGRSTIKAHRIVHGFDRWASSWASRKAPHEKRFVDFAKTVERIEADKLRSEKIRKRQEGNFVPASEFGSSRTIAATLFTNAADRRIGRRPPRSGGRFQVPASSNIYQDRIGGIRLGAPPAHLAQRTPLLRDDDNDHAGSSDSSTTPPQPLMRIAIDNHANNSDDDDL
jgi:sodium/hydrogen exchanger 3